MTRRLSARTRANRVNASKSTGPRTPAGKAIVAANALVHGFARQNGPVFTNEQLNAVAQQLAPQVTAQQPGAFALARSAAEAHLHLKVIRSARDKLWAQLPPAVSAYVGGGQIVTSAKLDTLTEIAKLDRYERRAAARRRRALRELVEIVANQEEPLRHRGLTKTSVTPEQSQHELCH